MGLFLLKLLNDVIYAVCNLRYPWSWENFRYLSYVPRSVQNLVLINVLTLSLSISLSVTAKYESGGVGSVRGSTAVDILGNIMLRSCF